jgi:hypothetical protein
MPNRILVTYTSRTGWTAGVAEETEKRLLKTAPREYARVMGVEFLPEVSADFFTYR